MTTNIITTAQAAQLAQLATCKAAWATHTKLRTSETLKMWRLNCEMLMTVGEPKPERKAKTTPVVEAPAPVVAAKKTRKPKAVQTAPVDTPTPVVVEVEADYVNPDIF